MLHAKGSGSQTASADCGAYRSNAAKVFVQSTDKFLNTLSAVILRLSAAISCRLQVCYNARQIFPVRDFQAYMGSRGIAPLTHFHLAPR